MSRIVSPGFGPAETQPLILVSADVLQNDDCSGESWWAGAQQCFTYVAVAAAVLVAGQAAQAQAVTTQDQGEIWAEVSRGGSGNVLPIFIEPSLGKYPQQWEFEQHDRASPPLDESPYQPPAPWPPTTAAPFLDTDPVVPQPAPPVQDEGEYAPPAPWPQTTAPAFVDTDTWQTTPPTTLADEDPGYRPPAPWPPTADRALWWADEFGPPQAAPELRVTEDAYQPPKPWGQGYRVVPLPGRGGRVDQFQVGALQVTEDEHAPPRPWPVPVQPLLWWPQDEWPTPPSPIITDDYGPSLSVRLVEPTVTLWLVDEAPPWNYEDEGWQPPQPWPAQFQSLGPRWPDEQWPTAAAALQVEPDPWPLPLPWASTAYQAILGHPDEQPTVPPPVGLDADPWFPPAPWTVPIQAPLLGWQDELASIVALAGDASSVEPVVRVWPTPLVQQPIVGEDEKILLVPIALETDELFPKVFVERIWVVPQPWQYEQHAIAFLSPHIPVMIRDHSGPRYIVVDSTGTRYRIEDDSNPRYEVEP